MKAVIQRVSSASVSVKGEIIAKINRGLAILVAVSLNDNDKDIEVMADKICNLRIFEDNKGKMNLSVSDINGDILVVSQFTLLADLGKGRRPSFTQAAMPENAENIYNKLIDRLKDRKIKVECGRFGASMQVELVNDGPATFIFDTNKNYPPLGNSVFPSGRDK
jgi:D-tyrosyl-tRNA(Tyr) deacylase